MCETYRFQLLENTLEILNGGYMSSENAIQYHQHNYLHSHKTNGKLCQEHADKFGGTC